MSLLSRIEQEGHGRQTPVAPEGDANATALIPVPAAPPTSPPSRDAPSGLMSRLGTTARSAVTTGDAGTLLRQEIQARLVTEMADSGSKLGRQEVELHIASLVEQIIREKGITITRSDRARVVDDVTHDVLGLGALDDLLHDDTVSEIMINGYKKVYVEKNGHMTKSAITFESDRQVLQIVDRIVSRIGRRIDESSPMVDARLEDGSRVHIIIPPLALNGPTITIRKFGKEALRAEDLVTYGTCTQDMLDFVAACVRARLNIAVSGGGTSGKTTTLNVLSGFIPEDERIVTIEDAAELQLHQMHVVPLETRPANVEGTGQVSIRELVINSLRMRPDRIVIGECRGGEALDMLQAMNTGHDGSLTTLHANSAKEVVSRLETLVLMAGADLPSRAIREQISSAINIIIQQSRLRDGTRKIMSISEVIGIEGDDVAVQDLFRYHQTGIDDDGNVQGYHAPTGITPFFLEHLSTCGEDIDERMFTAPTTGAA